MAQEDGEICILAYLRFVSRLLYCYTSLTHCTAQLPMIDPSDTPADQSDIVHHGIQELLHEQYYYSGVFIEDVEGGVSVGHGETMPVSG